MEMPRSFFNPILMLLVYTFVFSVAQLMLNQPLTWTVLVFPRVLLPLAPATLGFAWFLAGLGVYVRDIGQITGMITTVLLFLSPVFYPLSALPEQYQTWLHLNPLTFIIEEGRNTLIFGRVPDIGEWGMMLAVGVLISWAGFAWFQKIRKGFADVL